MGVLDANFNQKVDEKTREFNRWKELFTLTLEKPSDSDVFINKFETCVSKLREHKSKGVEDECLMRAILLHAVRADEFEHCKLKITKNTTMQVSEILQSVKQHFIAVKTNEDLIGITPNSKKVTFARNVNLDRKNEGKGLLDKKRIWIPPFPVDFKDVISNKVMNKMKYWRDRANRNKQNDKEYKLFTTPSFHLFNEDERPLKPPDNYNPNFKSGRPHDNDGKDYKRKRDSKNNRHSSGKYGSRRSRHSRNEDDMSISSASFTDDHYSSDDSSKSQDMKKS